ncbi:MAG: hypothetical protein QNK23_01045 [Crocinitomicaceae bacterium]|nr:hypothetical protein [Crocinitomicaceae bacterium]
MKIVKHIVPRIFLLAAILFATSYIYTEYLYEDDLQEHSPIINTIREIPLETDILYVGESSNIMYAEDDADKRTISEMLAGHYPSLTVFDLSKRASHAGIFKTFLAAIPEDKEIKTLVMTLNIRSFGANWIHSSLETPLAKNNVLLGLEHPIIKRFYLSFKAYDNDNEQVRRHNMLAQWDSDELIFPYDFPYANTNEWDDAMAATGIKLGGGKIDPVTDLACHYIKAYAFQIDTLTNPRIQDFNEIIALANERGWNVVFNLLGENLEKADELVGKDLLFLMEQNHNLVVDYFERQGVTVVDNFSAVSNQYFIDQDWTSEHYTEEGRSHVAGNVAKHLRIFHPDAYQED